VFSRLGLLRWTFSDVFCFVVSSQVIGCQDRLRND